MSVITWNLVVAIAICIMSLYSCATMPEKIEKEKPKHIEPVVETIKVPGPKVEETKSLELFSEVLDLVESTDDRKSVLPKIEGLYMKIIRQYPDTPLAQESYWKLISIYVQDYSPPAYGKATKMYKEFLEKYPQSFLQRFIEDTLGNGYYKNADWKRLIKLTTPAYNEYLEKGKQPRASLMFMYAEANYNLGNLKEAEKSYKLVSELFPKLIVGINSKKMLQKLGKIKN